MRFPRLANAPAELARLWAGHRRVLLFGAPGTGKSTLAAALGTELARQGRALLAITADPGSPAFGAPGAVAAAAWGEAGWRLLALEAVCALDAARFRLPLLTAVRRLLPALPEGPLLVDSPGLVRGPAAPELLQGLVEAAAVDAVLVIVPRGGEPPLPAELRGLGVELAVIEAAAEARDLSKLERARRRTALWEAYLGAEPPQKLDISRLNWLGLRPPVQDWRGRQVALQRRGRTLALGEVLEREGTLLTLRLPPLAERPDSLLIRDAGRNGEGLLRTAVAPAAEALPPLEADPLRGLRVGAASAVLVNGVLGDPLLLLRLINQRRVLLFDLGEAARLGAGLLHQVSDVFISHAHIDHIAGFLWLLRARIGETAPCRLFGPPGLAGHIQGMVAGVLWDRIGERGPVFEVAELQGQRLRRYRIQAGAGCEERGEAAAAAGLLLDEPALRVRAVALDHGFGTPTLAYAFEPPLQLNVRKERLQALGLTPGPWLSELKRRVHAGEETAVLTLPDGRREPVAELAEALLLRVPGAKLAYATDLADTPENRRRLIALAAGAHTFICEASFRLEDAGQAERTGHLTTRACGEIARAAEAQRLVPFHFAHRYQADLEPGYREIEAVFQRVVRLPGPLPPI